MNTRDMLEIELAMLDAVGPQPALPTPPLYEFGDEHGDRCFCGRHTYVKWPTPEGAMDWRCSRLCSVVPVELVRLFEL